MPRTSRATSASSRWSSGLPVATCRSVRAVMVTVLSLSEAMELGVGAAVGRGIVGGEVGPAVAVAVAALLVVVGAQVGRVPPTDLEGGPRRVGTRAVGPRPEETNRRGREREHPLLEGLRCQVRAGRLQ